MMRNPRVLEKAQPEIRQAFKGKTIFGLANIELPLAQLLHQFD
jgi:hypothetical protein